jgi:hypothetical protein
MRGVYSLLTRRNAPDETLTTSLIRHKLQVPVKVSVLAWRLFRNRLPTRDNLVKCHIIASDAHFCVIGCGGMETVHHLFLSCPVFAQLWSLIRSWVDISSADPWLIHDHFVQFTYSAGASRARRSFL